MKNSPHKGKKSCHGTTAVSLGQAVGLNDLSKSLPTILSCPILSRPVPSRPVLSCFFVILYLGVPMSPSLVNHKGSHVQYFCTTKMNFPIVFAWGISESYGTAFKMILPVTERKRNKKRHTNAALCPCWDWIHLPGLELASHPER